MRLRIEVAGAPATVGYEGPSGLSRGIDLLPGESVEVEVEDETSVSVVSDGPVAVEVDVVDE